RPDLVDQLLCSQLVAEPLGVDVRSLRQASEAELGTDPVQLRALHLGVGGKPGTTPVDVRASLVSLQPECAGLTREVGAHPEPLHLQSGSRLLGSQRRLRTALETPQRETRARLLRREPGLREPERGLVPQRLLSDPSVRRELRHASALLAALEPDARRSTEIRRLPLTPRRLLLSSERRALRGGLALDGSRVALRLAHCRRAPAEPATRARQRELAGHRLVGRELQLRLRRARPLRRPE